ncbi:MAG: AI-2E family transporter [Casimicrobiaceae bacterium]
MAAKSAVSPVAHDAPHRASSPSPIALPKSTIRQTALIVIAVIAAIGAARVAQPFLVPVVTGILLSYTLRPLVSLLERARVPRTVAATVVMSMVVAMLSAVGYVLRDDVNAAVAELPVAARKLRQEVADAARGAPGAMTHVKNAALELDKAAAEATGKSSMPTAPATGGVAAKVQEFVARESGQAFDVVAEIAAAMVLCLFLLAAGDTFRRKVTKIAGASLARRRVTIELLNEIDGQIQAYMLTLLIANSLIGIATWIALLILGVPNAGMWGVLNGLLHVIPYAGSVIAAAAVGIAVFLDTGIVGNSVVAIVVVLAISATISMVLATWMQGRAARMNPVAVFICVLFFGWLWGGWGLLLGMPILAVLKCIADRIDVMQPVSELLSA